MSIRSVLTRCLVAAILLPLQAEAEDVSHLKGIIEWEVVQPFPFLRSIQGFQSLKAGLDEIKQSGDFALYASAVSHAYRETAWDSAKEEIDRHAVLGEKIDVKIRFTVPRAGICRWVIDDFSINADCGSWTIISVPVQQATTVVVELQGGKLFDQQKIEIFPRRRIIIGLGDSFSSGEGNPDRPARWSEERIKERHARNYQRRWPLHYDPTEDEFADWNDVKCHRSLFSWQFMYALDRAGRDRHEVVVFASFACSGAEVYDGILVTQTDRNGRPKSRDSQLNEAVKLLCKGKPELEAHGMKYRAIAEINNAINIYRCPAENFFKPDEVLLSIGGNDVGFGGLISWSAFPANGYTWLASATTMKLINSELMPKTGMVCPRKESGNDWRCKRLFASAEEIESGRLAENIAFVHDRIASHLGIDYTKLYHVNYPVPTRNEHGKICDFDAASRASRALKNELFWNFKDLDPFARMDLPWSIERGRYNVFSVGPLAWKVKEVENSVIYPMQAVISATAGKGVNVVDVSPPFKQHGYCAKSSRWDLEMVTRHRQPGVSWWPASMSPQNYNPWRPVERWFRTPNDAQLTMLADNVYGRNAWIAGAFHPNHLGHFSMFKSFSESRSQVENIGKSTMSDQMSLKVER